MPKKQDKETTPPADAPPSAAPAQYPEVTESRRLKTFLKEGEKRDASLESARLVQEIAGLEEEKKASASDYKARIEGKQARQTLLARLVIDGWEERPQKCAWYFECAGLDADGNKIYHPEQKALVRLDTNEVVEILAMTETDFASRELALGDEKKPEETDEEPIE